MPDTLERPSVTRLDTPELRAIGERLLEGVQLALERAIAEHLSPGAVPFPRERRSLEASFLRRLKDRPPAAQARAKAWLDDRRTRPRPGGLEAIDLARAEPVLAQVARLAPAASLTLETLRREGAPQPLSGPAGGPPTEAEFATLALRVHRLKCHALTSGAGNDEITLSGSAVSATGRTVQAKTIVDNVSFTHDGHVRTFSPPREFTTFAFADDNTVEFQGAMLPVGWPRRYLATFLLAEIDNGGFPDFVKDIVEELKSASVAEIKAGVAAAVGGIGGPLGAAIAGALVWVAAKLTDWIITNVTALIVSLWEDDPFLPVVSSLELPDAVDPFSGKTTTGERHWNLKAHGGHYEFFFDWHLAGKQVATPIDKEILSPGVLAWRASANVREKRLDVFMRGMDRGAYHIVELAGGWSGWGKVPNIEATFLSAPAAVSWAPGRMELLALGDDGRLYQNSKNGDDWSGWKPHTMAGTPGDLRFRFGPAAVSRRLNHVDVFATTTERRILHAAWNGEQWSGWLGDLPTGLFLSGPAATARGADRLDVLALGEDRRIYLSSWHSGAPGWSVWAPIPHGTFTSAPAACDWEDERLHVFARGDDRQIYHSFWADQSWSGWSPGPGAGTFRSGPAAVSRQPGTIDLFAVGDDDKMWRSRFDGTAWSGWLAGMGDGTFA